MKTALITGASSGIGAATALELANHGLRVALFARRQDRLEAYSLSSILWLSPWMELFFGRLIDRLGPLLLQSNNRITHQETTHENSD